LSTFVDEEYVSSTAALEAAEAFYRLTPAYTETLDTGVLESYFNADIFTAMKYLPPRDHVTAVTFFIDTCV
jgi:hypothetical protein